jgi:hypothetical protein
MTNRYLTIPIKKFYGFLLGHDTRSHLKKGFWTKRLFEIAFSRSSGLYNNPWEATRWPMSKPTMTTCWPLIIPGFMEAPRGN